MRAVFQKKGQKKNKKIKKGKKKGKPFKNLGKNIQNLKIFCKRVDDCVRLSLI